MAWFRSNKDNPVARSPGAALKLPELKAADISSVSDLDAAHYVYLVTFTNDEQIVLKAEKGIGTADQATSHDLGVRIMGLVSAVKAVVISPAELLAVSSFQGCPSSFASAKREVASGQYTWVKAALQRGLAGAKDTFREKDPQKLIDIKADMALLNKQLKGNTKAWRSFGRVVAIDTFNGNFDRVLIKDGDVVNIGNVMFRREGKKVTEAIGLDTFDPSGASGVGNFANFKKEVIDEWGEDYGQYLKDPKLAGPKITSIIDVLRDKFFKRDYGLDCTFGGKEAKAMFEGYQEGVEIMKKRVAGDAKRSMGGKSGNFHIPQGILVRLMWLGWL